MIAPFVLLAMGGLVGVGGSKWLTASAWPARSPALGDPRMAGYGSDYAAIGRSGRSGADGSQAAGHQRVGSFLPCLFGCPAWAEGR